MNVQTDGIETKSFKLKIGKSAHPKGIKVKEVDFVAYDFAGQRSYFVTHHLFLTARALYMIVFDITNLDYTIIEYWISSIRSIQLSADELQPQILLVGTHLDHMDDVSADDIVDRLRERYRHAPYKVSGVVAVNGTQFGKFTRMNELCFYLTEMALRSPQVPQAIPRSFYDLKERLNVIANKDNVPWMSLEDFQLHLVEAGSDAEEVIFLSFTLLLSSLFFFSLPSFSSFSFLYPFLSFILFFLSFFSFFHSFFLSFLSFFFFFLVSHFVYTSFLSSIFTVICYCLEVY